MNEIVNNFPRGIFIDSSFIESLLGPNKSSKAILDNNETTITSCPANVLQITHTTDPIGHLITETLNTQHEVYGCGMTSLLAMWYFWNERFKILIDNGYETSFIFDIARKCLNYINSHLHEIEVSLKSLVEVVDKELESKSNKEKSSFDKISVKKIPSSLAGITMKSRHFSSPIADEDGKNENADHPRNQITLSKQSYDVLYAIVQGLCHGRNDFSEVITDIWKYQIETSGCLSRFDTDYISVQKMIKSCPRTNIVVGILLKSCLVFPQSNKCHRSLLISGDVVADFVHLGFNPSVSVRTIIAPQEISVSKTEKWRKHCESLLKELQITALFVRGRVDEAILEYCRSNSISVFCNISAKQFQMLSTASELPAVTYLLDSNQNDVIRDITFETWQQEITDLNLQFVRVLFLNKKSFQTVVFGHPITTMLDEWEHQFWHCISRLQQAAKSSILPGGGKTEEWCLQKLNNFAEGANYDERTIIDAIGGGFAAFHDAVSRKSELTRDTNVDLIYDTKTDIWNMALSLAFLTFNADSLIVNGLGMDGINDEVTSTDIARIKII